MSDWSWPQYLVALYFAGELSVLSLLLASHRCRNARGQFDRDKVTSHLSSMAITALTIIILIVVGFF